MSTQALFPNPGRRRRWPRRLALALGGLLLVLAALLAGGRWWLRQAMLASLPRLDGTLQVAGLSAPVEVRRDAHGIPHIAARTLDDLVAAQGYVTAQDRLWQMDMLRRSARGELAELLGPRLVSRDRRQRVLRLGEAARSLAAQMSPRDRRFAEDYASGVNAYIASSRGHLPAEFRLLGYSPQPWSAEDSMLVVVTMVQMLDTHFEAKLGREQVRAALAGKPNAAALEADLYPETSWRDRSPLAAPPAERRPAPPAAGKPQRSAGRNRSRQGDEEEDDESPLQIAALPADSCPGCAPGSNEWAISGAHTASGRPLLANDMHLSLGIPDTWYEADLEAPGFHAAGVTLPGLPFVVAGHNDHIAWGFTALYADVQDLYVETVNGHGEYLSTRGWQALERHRETIRVRGAGDVVLDLEASEHGPVITPLLPGEERTLALRWTLYDRRPGQSSLYDLNAADGWEAFRAALREWRGPTQNVVYADDRGNIGYQAIGRVPLRPHGLATVPVADRQHEWQGYIPFEQMPSVLNPGSGVIATANSRVTPDSSPLRLSADWISPYRTERISKWLGGKQGLAREDMLRLQNDVYSEVEQELAQRFAYAIERSAPGDSRLMQAASLLRRWDGSLTTDSAAASIAVRALEAFWPLVLEPRLGPAAARYVWGMKSFAAEEMIMHAPAQWLPPGCPDWDTLLTQAVRNGLRRGHAPRDLNEWRYGGWHQVELEHPLFGLLPGLRAATGSGTHPLSGDATTVKQVGRSFGPSQRFTIDWSDVDGATENLVMGESGNPLSPYYRDQWELWYAGRTFPLPYSRQAVAGATRHRLVLVP